MKKPLLLLALFFLTALSSFAQEPAGGCPGSAKGIYLHGNKVRAFVSNSGTLFRDAEGAAFKVPFSYPLKSTIYSQGLWLAGYGADGGLKVAAPTYGIGSSEFEYFPGPLNNLGEAGEQDCMDWDRVWQVQRHQVEAHLADLADNGTADNPIEEVMGWPGRGNPYFLSIYGFELPDTPQGLAPFHDSNGDGQYHPLDGDYPMIPNSAILPEQITWSVFNDAGGSHAESQGDPLKVEVQLTCWAFNCEDNTQLNNAVFTSYKIINRSGGAIDSLFLGLWLDFMLGCHWDDHQGSAPSLHTVFTYNHDNVDGYGSNLSGCGEETNYGKNPPVQAATILNHPLSSAMVFYNSGVMDPALGMSEPNSPHQYYYFLNGRWRDGEPLTYGRGGYNPAGNYPVTSFCFPGDPNEPGSWSSNHVTTPPYSQNLLPSVKLGNLSPDESRQIDVAYSYFRERGANYLENVTAMYAGVERLQEWYDSRFASVCTPPAICREDCIWPGDTNADGIANHYDLLPIGVAAGSRGPGRISPPNWFPQNGEDWGPQLPGGTDYKHADADGSGEINIEDFFTSAANYQLARPGYRPHRDIYRDGPEIFIRDSPGLLDTIALGHSRVRSVSIRHIPGLYGLAFSIDYDTNYFEVFRPYFGTGFDKAIPEYRRQDIQNAQVDYVRLAAPLESTIPEGRLLLLYLVAKSEFPDTLPSNTTPIRFKNIKAIRRDGTEIPLGGATAYFTIPGIPVWAETREAAAGDIRLFPNPTDGKLELRFPGQKMESIEVFDATGRRVWRQEGQLAEAATLDLGGLPGGVYFVRMLLEGKAVARRVFLVPRSS